MSSSFATLIMQSYTCSMTQTSSDEKIRKPVLKINLWTPLSLICPVDLHRMEISQSKKCKATKTKFVLLA